MGLKNDAVSLGLKAARHIAGDEGSAAITAASLANGADRVLSGARKKGAAIRAALDQDRVDHAKTPKVEVTPAGPDSLDGLSAKANAQPEVSERWKALVEGAVASFRQGVEAPSEGNDVSVVLNRVAEGVKGRSLVLVNSARELAAYAPAAPRTLGMGWRFARSKASADDVASLIDIVKNTDGLVSGYLKRKGFEHLLSRMKEGPDFRVFEALDAFSNSAEERWKALRSISRAIKDTKIPVEVAVKVVTGFKLMNGKDDIKAQLLALDLLVKHIETRGEGAQLVEAAWSDEATRHRAMSTLAATYNGMHAQEICAFLLLFQNEPARLKAAKILRPKLIDHENSGEIDKLFTPAKTIATSITAAEFPELARVKQAGARFLGSFFDGVRGRK